MHLEHKGGRKWRVRVSMGKDPGTGKYRVESRTFEAGTKTEAKRRAAEIELELKAGPRTSKASFGALLDRFVEEHEPLARTTRESYAGVVRNHIKPALGDIPVEELAPAHFHQLYRDLSAKGLRPSTINEVASVCKGACGHGRILGWLRDNPAQGVRRPPRPIRKVPLPPESDTLRVFAYVAESRPDMAALLWVAAATGMRRGELAGLRWGDLEGRVLHVVRVVDDAGVVLDRTKNERHRRVVLDDATLEVLEGHRRRQEAAWNGPPDPGWYIWPSPFGPGVPRNIDSLTRYVSRVRERLGVESKVTLKSMRHLSASVLVAGGTDPVAAAARLGHDPNVLLGIYAKPLSPSEIAAAELAGKAVRELFGTGNS